jgi:hypothetical protein
MRAKPMRMEYNDFSKKKVESGIALCVTDSTKDMWIRMVVTCCANSAVHTVCMGWMRY